MALLHAHSAVRDCPVPHLSEVIRAKCSASGAAVGAYVVAGDPTWDLSLAIVSALIQGGVDFIELGYPFSDPILDGSTIQRAQLRALSTSGSLARTLDLVDAIKERHARVPIVLMGYLNPILAFGPKRFAAAARASGVDSLIIADLPLHEAHCDDLLSEFAENKLTLIPLSVPNANLDPRRVDQPGVGGFVYCIPTVGPTGGQIAASDAIAFEVQKCRAVTRLPIAVGFGIRTEADVRIVAALADAAIVGTAIVSLVEQWLTTPVRDSSEIAEMVRSFAVRLCAAAISEPKPQALLD